MIRVSPSMVKGQRPSKVGSVSNRTETAMSRSTLAGLVVQLPPCLSAWRPLGARMGGTVQRSPASVLDATGAPLKRHWAEDDVERDGYSGNRTLVNRCGGKVSSAVLWRTLRAVLSRTVCIVFSPMAPSVTAAACQLSPEDRTVVTGASGGQTAAFARPPATNGAAATPKISDVFVMMVPSNNRR